MIVKGEPNTSCDLCSVKGSSAIFSHVCQLALSIYNFLTVLKPFTLEEMYTLLVTTVYFGVHYIKRGRDQSNEAAVIINASKAGPKF